MKLYKERKQYDRKANKWIGWLNFMAYQPL